LSEGQREYIGRILYNQRHLVRLVDELLDLAKIESGQFPLRLAAVSVQRILTSVQTMIEPQIQASRLRLHVLPCEEPLFLHGDGERVEQIVLNLLSNAVKFTPAGGDVSITACAREEVIELRVKDTGVGIPADKLEAVFAPFFQIEQSNTRARSGTGLGLAISRELARAMNGDLQAESVPGQGSKFTLSLPRTTVAAGNLS
jgi:signal transduction histidine kinase